MRRITDFAEPGLEIVFFDNNRLERLRFERDLENAEQTALCVESAQLFCELWRPDQLTVTVAALEHGGPADPRHEINLVVAPDGELPLKTGEWLVGEQMIAAIQTSVRGWNRIALPDGVSIGEAWLAVCADGMFPRTTVLNAAPPLAGRSTVWLRLDEALPASHLSLQVYSLGDLELRTMLGPSFFNPKNDPRPPTYDVRGRPLAEWQRANTAIYDHTLAALESLGWRRR